MIGIIKILQIMTLVYPMISYHIELFLRTDSLFRLLNLLVLCYFSNSVFGSMMSRAVGLTTSLNFSHRPTFYLKVNTHMRLMFVYQRTNIIIIDNHKNVRMFQVHLPVLEDAASVVVALRDAFDSLIFVFTCLDDLFVSDLLAVKPPGFEL